MNSVFAEAAAKGGLLGLLAGIALQRPNASALGQLAIFLSAGLVLGCLTAAATLFRQGFRPGGRPLLYGVFVLLEQPGPVFAGVSAGAVAAALWLRSPASPVFLMPALTAAGGLLGVAALFLRKLSDRGWRFGVALSVALVTVGGVVFALHQWPEWIPDRREAGAVMLIGLPFIYILMFAGRAEETEAEAAAWCAALAVGLWLAVPTANVPGAVLLIPLTLYYVYATQILPGLRSFKVTLRGLGFARSGDTRSALRQLNRALQLDPRNALARRTLWDVHRRLNPAGLADDPELFGLIDWQLCLDRAASILSEPPTADRAAEATNLLDLIAARAPDRVGPVTYWRCVLLVHQKDVARAAAELARLLDPTAWPADDAHRRDVLLPAWNLALTLHPALRTRVGEPQLKLPGRRAEAITAVEAKLAVTPDEPTAWTLKRLLYADLTEADLNDTPVSLDAAYLEQLGSALIDEPARWPRGLEFLRLAARAAPADGPTWFVRAAKAARRHGDAEGERAALHLAKQAGSEIGIPRLSEDAKAAFFSAVKALADAAAARGDLDAAVADYQIFTESVLSGVETLRTLADLHERRGDALAALRAAEQGLIYAPDDADLKARRDKYAYSVTPEQLRSAPEPLRSAVNVPYCLRRAKQLLDRRDIGADLLDWADHLLELVAVVKPDDLNGRVLLARARLRKGDRPGALELLERVRRDRPSSWFSSDDEEAWMTANRMLGDLYLNEFDRPADAIACFNDFRSSARSGADTLYKLGLAHERIGEFAKAAKWYEQVTAYEGHPLTSEARAAIRRVSAGN